MSKSQSNSPFVEVVAIYTPDTKKLHSGSGGISSSSHRLIRFKDERGEWRELIMDPEPLLDWRNLRKYLCMNGHPLVTENGYWQDAREKLIQPIEQEFKLCNKVGYHGGVYLDSRGSVFGKDASIYRVHPSLNLENIHEDQSGTLDEWKKNVAVYAEHSDPMMFCICASLSGALLYFTDMESGGFQLHDDTSKGKSTIFFAAGSVCGNAGFVRKWYTTATAIEEAAFKHNDNVLILDDTALLEEHTKSAAGLANLIQQLIYLLSSGEGKQRAGTYQTKALTWRIIYLSNGEKSLREIAREGNINRMGGSEVRCIDVPCNMNTMWGVFKSLPEGFNDSRPLAEHIESQAKTYFGTAKPAFIEGLLKWEQKRKGKVRKKIDVYMEKFISKCGIDPSDGPSARIAKRFALTYAAGAIAVDLNVLDFEKSQIGESVLGLYNASINPGAVSEQKLLQKAHKRVLKRFARQRLVDLSAIDTDLTEEEVGAARGFVTTFRGREIFAVTRRQFESQVGDKSVASQLINRYKAKGVLMSCDKKDLTFQLSGGAAGKRLPRCLCLLPEKMK